MHPYGIVAQICLILSILNLVLAAPIMVQKIHEAREAVVAEDAAAMPTRKRELEAASDRLTRMSPRSSQDAMASPQHSSSGYPTPHLSSGSSESGNSWLLDRPPRLSLHDPVPPYPPIPGPLERQTSLPLLLQGLSLPSSHFPSPGPPEIPPSPQHPESDRAMAETYSPPERFTPSRHSSSLSSNSWNSHSSISEGSPPTETPQNNAKFFNKNVMKKFGIVAGVAIVGGAIGGIVGSQIKHREYQDH